MVMKKYNIEITGSEKSIKIFEKILNEKNQFFKLSNLNHLSELSIIDKNEEELRVNIAIDNHLDYNVLFVEEYDILSLNTPQKDALFFMMIMRILRDFKEHLFLEFQDADKKEEIADLLFLLDQTSVFANAFKSYAFNQDDYNLDEKALKVFTEFINSNEYSSISLIKYHRDTFTFPVFENFDDDEIPFNYSGYEKIKLDWTNLLFSLNLKLKIISPNTKEVVHKVNFTSHKEA